jgi:hypothetical protein
MLACPCECNSGGFCGGCGHAGCSGGINLRRRMSLKTLDSASQKRYSLTMNTTSSTTDQPIQGPHCRSCGANDGETLYLARENEGYTECCNKSLAYDCDSERCTHLDKDITFASEAEAIEHYERFGR